MPTTGTARLSADEEAITFIELRGNSRVTGGSGTLDAMSARDIDLDYTDDGETLERVLLNGRRRAGADRAERRQRTPDQRARPLDVALAPDGDVTRATRPREGAPRSAGIGGRRRRAASRRGCSTPTVSPARD